MSYQKSAVKLLAVAAVLIYAGSISAGAPSIVTNSFANYGAEVILSGGNLTITALGVDAVSYNQTKVGDTQVGAITMASTGSPAAKTALISGYWAYRVEVQAITGSTAVSTDFQIDLMVNGTITDTLFISSDGSPATGELVNLTFDLGTATLGDQQSFVILATAL